MGSDEETKDSGNSVGCGSYPGQTCHQAAAGAADAASDKGLHIANINTEDSRFRNTQEGGQGGRKGHCLGFLVPAFEGQSQGCRSLSYIGCRSNGHPDIEPSGAEKTCFNGIVHMMHPGHYRDCVEGTDDQTADPEGKSDEPPGSGQHPVLRCGEDRTDYGQGQVAGYQHRYQGSHEEIDDLRHNPVQLLLQPAHQPNGDDNGNHVSLVTHQVDVIEAEPSRGFGNVCRLHTGHRPGIEKIRMDHNHTDNSPQELIASKGLGCADGNEDRQEYKGCIAEQVKDLIGPGICHGGPEIAKALQQTHQKTAGYNSRNNGNKDISQGLDGPQKGILPGGCRCLNLLLGPGLNPGQLDEFLEDLVHRSCSQDNLYLAGGFEDSLHSFRLLQSLLAALLVISDHQPQAGGTMSSRQDIAAPADMGQDPLRYTSVIHLIPSLPSLKLLSYSFPSSFLVLLHPSVKSFSHFTFIIPSQISFVNKKFIDFLHKNAKDFSGTLPKVLRCVCHISLFH